MTLQIKAEVAILVWSIICSYFCLFKNSTKYTCRSHRKFGE